MPERCSNPDSASVHSSHRLRAPKPSSGQKRTSKGIARSAALEETIVRMCEYKRLIFQALCRSGLKLAVCSLVVTLAACNGPAKTGSPFAVAERRAWQATIDRCMKSNSRGEMSKEACQLAWDMLSVPGVRWAKSQLQPDGRLREGRAEFDLALARKAQTVRRDCLNGWLTQEGKNGPPNLDPTVLGQMRAMCFGFSVVFSEGANALVDQLGEEGKSTSGRVAR